MSGDDKTSKPMNVQEAKTDAPPLTEQAQGRIGRELRNAYREMLNEPLPDKFSKLIEDLAKSEKGS